MYWVKTWQRVPVIVNKFPEMYYRTLLVYENSNQALVALPWLD